MGMYFYIVGHETRTMCYVGKGSYDGGQPRVMYRMDGAPECLRAFMNANIGKPVVVLDDMGGMADEYYEYRDFDL